MVFLDPDTWNLNMRDFLTGRACFSGISAAQENFMENSELNWVLTWMRKLNLFPFMYQTWIGHGHTIDMEGFETGNYHAWVIKKSEILNPDFNTFKMRLKKVQFYVMIPIFQQEMILTQQQGTEKLFQLLKQNDVSEITIQNRKSVV